MKKLLVMLATVGLSSPGIARELLIVRGSGFYPPNEMVIEKKLTGLHIDIVTEVATRLGMRVNFKTTPWRRAVFMMKNGDADAVTYMSKTKKRSEFAYFHEGNILSHVENGFFTLKDRIGTIQYAGDYRELEPYRIGKLAGFSYDPVFDTVTYLQQNDGARTEEQLLHMLAAGRVDIAVGEISRIKYIAQQLGLAQKIEFLRPAMSRRSVYLAFSKPRGHEQLARRFADEMVRFKQSERFRELLRKYALLKNSSPPPPS